MKKLFTAAIAATLLTVACLYGVQASEAPKSANCPPPLGGPGAWGPRPGMMGGPGLLGEADLNKDGRITHAEIDQATKARFDAADANHDGALDEKEFEAARPKPSADQPKPPEGGDHHGRFGGPEHMFKRLDWNGDGKLSLDEFAEPVRTMAMRLDRDGDGVIAQDELRGPPGPPPPPPPPQ